MSQSQKLNNDNGIINAQNGLDDENSVNNSLDNHFIRAPQLPKMTNLNNTIINNKQQLECITDNEHQQHLNIQIKTEQDPIYYPTMKQQPIVFNHLNNNKRTFHQINVGKILSELKIYSCHQIYPTI